MTVSTTTSRVAYAGNGATTSFAVTFPFFTDADLFVYERVVSSGVTTLLTLGFDYTITGGEGSTGTVEATTAPQSAVHWIIVRNHVLGQPLDLENNATFPADDLEEALDNLELQIIDARRVIDKALVFPDSDDLALDPTLPSSDERASMYLGFDAEGEPVALAAPVDSTNVSAFAVTLLDDTTAAAARTTLDAQEDVITTRGDIVRGSSINTPERLAKGASGTFLRSGSTDVAWASPASSEVSSTPVSPMTANNLADAIDQLNAQYSVNTASDMTDVGTSIVAITGMANISIPGGGDSVKKFIAMGQVNITGTGGSVTAVIKLHLGAAGTTGDAVIGTWSWGTSAAPVTFTGVIPTIVFTPASGNKITVSITISAAGSDITGAGSQLILKKFSNA